MVEKRSTANFKGIWSVREVPAGVGHRVYLGDRKGESWKDKAIQTRSFCAVLRNMDFIWQAMEGFSDRSWISLTAEWVRGGEVLEGDAAAVIGHHLSCVGPTHLGGFLPILGSHLSVGICEMVGVVANHPIGC